jgi:hypothetical protein
VRRARPAPGGCVALAIAALAGCAAPALPEYSPDEAEAAGLYPGPRRWKIDTARATARPLGTLCTWRPPAPTPVSGLGVVVGLRQSGDQGAAAQQLLDFWAQQVEGGAFAHLEPPERPGSAALVAVEAVLPVDGAVGPAEVRPLGNATSLEGGRLLPAALRGGDEVLAVAEGPVILTRIAPDGKVVRDPQRGRVAQVVPRRPPDTRRLEFELHDRLPGAAAAAVAALEAAWPGATVRREAGPPPRCFVSLSAPIDRAAVAAVLDRPVAIPVGEPGCVVVHGGGRTPERVELLGPPAALGPAHVNLTEQRPDGSERSVRVVGVPTWQGQPIRRALVEFDAPDGRRVRVVASNRLAELLPVVDRTGVPLRNLAAALAHAHDAGRLATPVVVEWRDRADDRDPPDDQGGDAGGR